MHERWAPTDNMLLGAGDKSAPRTCDTLFPSITGIVGEQAPPGATFFAFVTQV